MAMTDGNRRMAGKGLSPFDSFFFRACPCLALPYLALRRFGWFARTCTQPFIILSERLRKSTIDGVESTCGVYVIYDNAMLPIIFRNNGRRWNMLCMLCAFIIYPRALITVTHSANIRRRDAQQNYVLDERTKSSLSLHTMWDALE